MVANTYKAVQQAWVSCHMYMGSINIFYTQKINYCRLFDEVVKYNNVEKK